ncbi:oxygen-dependent protoporphyrinogen oxidase [Aspergillus fischeri NRRL 181]|uniref:Protoporphyrinogen oxidase n=1 Tax=Neosartorya fischeri (strain ATCC 1020 / DSM 3700 / CBS 544.65 / FGSC A1164 / JCM 1740 / NRRL 181 / WB 181) TaxID=331117 RepID=A1DMP2_NEOFI|nr:protoporphyrinogen oxidase, putative [Aspergillus fischeri NRRL 181]EAW16063.1 protoporphyrinogen oxidase, putative [Aspergillus fischeri NRRL 181]
MRLPCAPSLALRASRTPLAFARNGQKHSLHTGTYNAAVIGGGITGLATAFRLSQDPKCTNITLYEKQQRVGGWMMSETIPLGDNDGKVVFEYGPRTLRAATPACLPLLDLLVELELLEDVLITTRSSPAAQNRYIYYPDHLVRMPGRDPGRSLFSELYSNFRTLLTEPVFDKLLRSVVTEPLKLPPEPKSVDSDESVRDFISRRLAPEIADNIVSAVYHGIYAGDIDRLSAQTLLGTYRDLEHDDRRVIGGLVHAATSDITYNLMDDWLALHSLAATKQKSYWSSLKTLVRDASVITFKNGVQQLTDALAAALRKSGKVDLLTGTEVKAISTNPVNSDLTIHFGERNSNTHNRVIATNPPPNLAQQLAKPTRSGQRLPQNSIRQLQEHNYAVSVMVVNILYENPNLLPVNGFGYLIPQSVPFEQNPEMALGVIFGSESSVGQDTVPCTKLTVMLGGHYWDGWKTTDYPDPDTAIGMCQILLQRHLGITEQPLQASVKLQRQAIPQYTVGHLSRMRDLSQTVRQDFNNRLTLAGNWYNGVGVTDCVRQAYMAASYGVGALKLDAPSFDVPWIRYNWQGWELEGGIPTSPVRITGSYRSERKYFF